MQGIQRKLARKFSVEDKLRIQMEQGKNDKFQRVPAISNRMRVLSHQSRAPPQDLNKHGFIHQQAPKEAFDPLRLKVLVLPFQDANPIGKNADYFFLKAFKHSAAEDYAHALSSYLKGLEIKPDHLLCRFNLGVILFRLGLFEEAYSQYHTLLAQGYAEKPIVHYNLALACLQCGKYSESLKIARKCLELMGVEQ